MIIPAILEQTTEGFEQKLAQIKKLPDIKRIQVDFCDGQFVAEKSVSVEELGHLDSKYEWEAHLMMDSPIDFEPYLNAGFSHIIVHYEAYESEALLEEALLAIVELGLTPAIAINPETQVSVLRYDTDTILNFTIMSVYPGQQGQSFIEESIERVRELREIAPDATIEVDGGVNRFNAEALVEAGADNLVVGSALFETEDIKQNYRRIAEAI